MSVLVAGLLAVALAVPATAEEPQTQPTQTRPAQTQPAEGEPAEPEAGAAEPPAQVVNEPDRIKVQHILIGFKGSAQGTQATRSADEARNLANEILERAKKGEDFDELVRQYTEDQPPGIYAMANNGVPTKPPPPREFPRGQMVPAFGNVGFVLKVGDVGMADYDLKNSPYGYHIIKRLE